MGFTRDDKENRKFEADPSDSSKVVVKTKVENQNSDPIPVTIVNPDSNIDLEVTVSPSVTINDSTPIDVAVTGTPNVSVTNTPSVTVSGQVDLDDATAVRVDVTNAAVATNATIQNASLNTNATIQNSSIDTNATIQGTPNVNITNSNINSYSYVHDGAQWRFQLADSNGKAINLDHTYYTSAEITALGSSTDINLWLSAYNDSMLQLKFVDSYNDEHEETVYYQHPSLGNGTKCLRLIFQYSTENSQVVVKSIHAAVSDWSFSDDIEGTVSISAGAITSPPTSSSIHTVVTTLTITDNTVGGVTLSLSGTHASFYHLHEVETGTHSQSTLTYVAGRTYQVHAHSGFVTTTYTHNITVTATGDVFGVSDSVNIETTNTGAAPPSWANDYYLLGGTGSRQECHISFSTAASFSITWWCYTASYSNLTHVNTFYPVTTLKGSSPADEIFASNYPAGITWGDRNNSSSGNPNYHGLRTTSGFTGWSTGTDYPLSGSWHHCVITWDSTYHSSSLSQSDIQSGLTYYVDNTQVAKSAAYNGGALASSEFVFTGVAFGSHAAAYQTNAYDGGGRLTDVAIWNNHLLTSTERGLLYNSGTPLDAENTTGLTAPTGYWLFEDSTDLSLDTISGTTKGSTANFTRTAY